MKIQKQPPPCTALSYSPCWAPAETLGTRQWLGHESWLNDSFSAATGTLGDPSIKPRGRRGIGLTRMLCSDIYIWWALRQWLTQWPLYAQTQQSQGQSWGLALHREVLLLVKTQANLWVAGLWLGNLASNTVFTHWFWPLPCSLWSWFCFSWFSKNGASGLWIKSLRQRPLWLSCFNNSQQRMEMHQGIYRMGPGLVGQC